MEIGLPLSSRDMGLQGPLAIGLPYHLDLPASHGTYTESLLPFKRSDSREWQETEARAEDVYSVGVRASMCTCGVFWG